MKQPELTPLPSNPSDRVPSGAEAAWQPWLLGLGLLLLALAIYWPALTGEFLWDDRAHVTRAELRGWDGLARIWFEPGATQQYYPVLHSAFWIEHRLWGDEVVPYHLTNVFLHALNGGLLAAWLWWLLRFADRSVKQPEAGWYSRASLPWLAAALFVAHPVCVESVAWISEQKNTLSTAFYLGAALCYARFVVHRRRVMYAGAFVLYFLAIGTKTTAATLPAALLVVMWWRHGRLEWRRDVTPLLPWFLLAVPAGLVTAWIEKTTIGADMVVPDLAFVERALLASRTLWFYIGKLVWPADITFFYPLWDVSAQALGWTGYLLATVAVTAGLWAWRKRSRAPLAIWLLFGGTLFPALGFFKVFPFQFSYVADHFQYLAIPAAVTGASAALLGITHRVRSLRAVSPWLIGVVVLLLAATSRSHSRLYQNDEVLFRANVATNPTSWMGYRVLAHQVGKSPKRRAEAIALFQKSLELNPHSAETLAAYGGLLVMEPGHGHEAVALFEEAIRLRPTYAEAHNALANEIVATSGRLQEAIAHYETALRLRPDFALAEANLASALARDPDRQNEALSRFERVLKVLPDYAPAHYHFANLLARLPERRSEAVFHYEHTLRLQPNAPEVHLALGNVLADLGRLPEALTRFETALRIDPQFVGAHYAIAVNLLAARERPADVARHLDETLRLHPDYVEAHNLRGVFLAQQGQTAAARDAWNRALAIAPDYEPARRNLRFVENNLPGAEPGD